MSGSEKQTHELPPLLDVQGVLEQLFGLKLTTITGQRHGISKVKDAVAHLLSASTIQGHMATGNLVGVRECLENMRQIQEELSAVIVLDVVNSLFLQMQGRENAENYIDLAQCLLKGLVLFPKDNNNRKLSDALEKFNLLASEIILFCVKDIKTLRETRSDNKNLYTTLRHIVLACIIRMGTGSAHFINQNIPEEDLKILQKHDIKSLFDWCLRVGFDELEIDQIYPAVHLNPHRTFQERENIDKFIKSALAQEAKRWRNTRPSTIDIDGAEEETVF